MDEFRRRTQLLRTTAAALLATCERDYATLQYYFGGITPSSLPFRVFIDTGSNGGSHAGCSATVLHCDAFSGMDSDLVRMILVAEMDEVFMAAQNAGWNCGASNGEGLSRILAAEAYPAELNGFATGAFWLDSTRTDFVSNNDGTDVNPISTGCSVLFLNYLRYQLGFSWRHIVAAAGATLSKTYTNLTGRTDAFQAFSTLMNQSFPPGTPSNLTNDNPFPLPRRIGVLQDGNLFVKEGTLDAAWTDESSNVSAFQLDGNRIGVLQDGTLFVKEAALDAAWILESSNVSAFQLLR